MLKKSTMKTIPLAIAMTAALMFGAGAQAQTTPPTGMGGKANPPVDANTMPKTMEQRDAANPMAQPGSSAGAAGTGGSASPPAGANAMPKTMEQRDAAKPMAQSGSSAGVAGTGGKANPPASPNATPKMKNQDDKSKSGMNSNKMGSDKAAGRLDKLPQDAPRTTSR